VLDSLEHYRGGEVGARNSVKGEKKGIRSQPKEREKELASDKGVGDCYVEHPLKDNGMKKKNGGSLS